VIERRHVSSQRGRGVCSGFVIRRRQRDAAAAAKTDFQEWAGVWMISNEKETGHN